MPGTYILSTNSLSRREPPLLPRPNPQWCYMSGTSMAMPLVAGCVAVLREALINNGTESPSTALIKALLINGAEILSQPMLNVESGFGCVNLAKSIVVGRGEEGAAFRKGKFDQSTEKAFSFPIAVETHGTTLKVTLVWSDPSGEVIKNRLLLELKHVS
jgi:serine protease AprX